MSSLTSAQRARAIQRALKQVEADPGNADAMLEFRQLVPELTCPQCNLVFDRYRINQIYCSPRCRNLAGMQRHRRKNES